MGPLFSALLVVPSVALLFSVAFVVIRLFQTTSFAIRIAAVFVAGAVIGGGVTVVVLSFFVPTTLVTAWQVITYLASLAIGGVLGGVFLLFLCIKRRVLIS